MLTAFLLLSAFVLLFVLAYVASIWRFDYWKKRKVPFVNPTAFFGNFKEYILQKRNDALIAQEICKQFPNEPYVGAFLGSEPVLLVQDPELIKLIVAKDFYFFNGRAISRFTSKELVTSSLFFVHGDHWKVLRQNLSPLFSSGKMKSMFYLIQNCTRGLESLLAEEFQKKSILNVRMIMTRYTMDCIGSCVFGVNTKAMLDDYKVNPFFIMGNKIFEASLYRNLKVVGRSIWPAIFYGMGFKAFSKKVDDFFGNLLSGIFESRQHKPTSRHDFIDLVLSLKENDCMTGDSISNLKTGERKKVQLEAKDEVLIGQCAGLFGAGFETSAITLTTTLLELAKNVEAQNHAIAEVDDYLKRNKGKIEYECISELPYLNACLSESLRLYPVLGMITREVMDDYTLPTGLRVEKGLRIHLPVYHIHRHPDYFPEPERYRPERHLEGMDSIKPYTLLTFGEGPRICIGQRFAKMQMLPGLVTVLKDYRLEPPPDVPSLQMDPGAIVTQPKGKIHVKLVPRTDKPFYN